jgi:hypothetical protein
VLPAIPPKQARSCSAGDISWTTRAQIPDVAGGRCAEHACVFAGKLGQAFIADGKGHGCHITGLGKQYPACLVYSEVLLVLQRGQARARFEAAVKSGQRRFR